MGLRKAKHLRADIWPLEILDQGPQGPCESPVAPTFSWRAPLMNSVWLGGDSRRGHKMRQDILEREGTEVSDPPRPHWISNKTGYFSFPHSGTLCGPRDPCKCQSGQSRGTVTEFRQLAYWEKPLSFLYFPGRKATLQRLQRKVNCRFPFAKKYIKFTDHIFPNPSAEDIRCSTHLLGSGVLGTPRISFCIINI